MKRQILKAESSLVVLLANKKFAACENFQQASEIVSNFISASNYGATAFYKYKQAGVILHPTKGNIANVSYNGRVWNSSTKIEIKDLTLNDC